MAMRVSWRGREALVRASRPVGASEQAVAKIAAVKQAITQAFVVLILNVLPAVAALEVTYVRSQAGKIPAPGVSSCRGSKRLFAAAKRGQTSP